MTIEQGIVERLLSLGPLSALVSTRVRQLILRQGEILPAVRVQRIGPDMEVFHTRGPFAMKRTRISVDSYVAITGDAYASAAAVDAAVHGDGLGDNATGLSGFIGELGGSPPELKVWAVFPRGGRGPVYDFDEQPRIVMGRDYYVDWQEL